jgi:hypothetical protein
MLKQVTRDGKPVLINTDNIAWVAPNQNGGARVVFNSTPYMLDLDDDQEARPVFMDLDIDQGLDEIAAGEQGRLAATNGPMR